MDEDGDLKRPNLFIKKYMHRNADEPRIWMEKTFKNNS